MRELLDNRFVRAVLTFTGLLTTVGGPVPKVRPTLQPFTSNGCSVFPDGDTYGCCYVHDMAYWSGGTAADRRRADRELHQCVADVSDSEVIGHVTGGIMYRAVSLFGLPGVPTRVRWGYGWKDTRQISYAALTRAEQDQVVLRKREACNSLIRDPGTGRHHDRRHALDPGDRRAGHLFRRAGPGLTPVVPAHTHASRSWYETRPL